LNFLETSKSGAQGNFGCAGPGDYAGRPVYQVRLLRAVLAGVSVPRGEETR
jgi:hypothetical protein